ncbi:MAG: hypothetical protein JO363_08345 [Solirubrobacterales bacterium]|nr:hypothetical protein [Solirubrobacterales bacterium]
MVITLMASPELEPPEPWLDPVEAALLPAGGAEDAPPPDVVLEDEPHAATANATISASARAVSDGQRHCKCETFLFIAPPSTCGL